MTYTFKLARRMARNHLGSRTLIALAATLLVACGGEGPTGATPAPTPIAPAAGVLTLELVTPNGNDGALQFAVSGPAIDSIRAVGYQGTTTLMSGQGQAILTGALTSGAVARVYVRDINRATDYRAWVVAAAARSTYQLQDVGSYRVVLVR